MVDDFIVGSEMLLKVRLACWETLHWRRDLDNELRFLIRKRWKMNGAIDQECTNLQHGSKKSSHSLDHAIECLQHTET